MKTLMQYLAEAYADRPEGDSPSDNVADFCAFAEARLAELGDPRTRIDRYGLRLEWPRKVEVRLGGSKLPSQSPSQGVGMSMARHPVDRIHPKSPAFGVISRRPEDE